MNPVEGKYSTIHYQEYLKLGKLLDAQELRSVQSQAPAHEEMLFIIVHQVYELWFKQILHEVDHVTQLLDQDHLADALGTLRRILTILKTVVNQIDILETMTPLQFNSFRAFLANSSGFQSVQFRELEFALGYKQKGMLTHFADDVHGIGQLKARFQAPSLWDTFVHFLARKKEGVPTAVLNRKVTEAIEPNQALQTILIEIYKNDPWLARLCERLVDLDEGLMEWRYRHVKMVARTIGAKMGTGGSAGVKYLESTVKPVWPDLWTIRSEF